MQPTAKPTLSRPPPAPSSKRDTFDSLGAASSTASSIVDKDMFGLVCMLNGKQRGGRVVKTPASWPLCTRLAGSGRPWGRLSA